MTRTWTTRAVMGVFGGFSVTCACTAAAPYVSEIAGEPSLRDGSALMRGRPRWSPPSKTLGDPSELEQAVRGSSSVRVETVSRGPAGAPRGLRGAMEEWISSRAAVAGSGSTVGSPEIAVTVRELGPRASSTSAGQAGNCEPLRQWLALHETLEIARHRATLETLEDTLRTQAQALLASRTSWRALEGASVERSPLEKSAAHARCQSAAASLHERLTACAREADACVDTPMVTLDGAVTLTRVDPWYPDRDTCLAELGAPARDFEAWMDALAEASVETVAAEPTLGALDRLARTRLLFEAVEDLCVPRRRVVLREDVDTLDGVLDAYGDLYGVAAVQTPAMESSQGVVYVAGRGTLRELGRTRPTSVARQLESLVHDFRARSEELGYCEAASGAPLEIVVARDGVEVLRTELFPEQLWCTPDSAAQ